MKTALALLAAVFISPGQSFASVVDTWLSSDPDRAAAWIRALEGATPSGRDEQQWALPFVPALSNGDTWDGRLRPLYRYREQFLLTEEQRQTIHDSPVFLVADYRESGEMVFGGFLAPVPEPSVWSFGILAFGASLGRRRKG
ncbi:MAG: hypothetical protein Q7Q71_10710 [Verrucomicrobiota bacterium JB023]|nr:hypothetical protein [Verrucomicrobiota bacterium JB023]